MMITQQIVSEKLLAYLDEQLSFDQIVAWAEQVIREGNYAPDSNIELLTGIVMSLAGADRPRSLQKVDNRSELMLQPDMRIRVMSVDAA